MPAIVNCLSLCCAKYHEVTTKMLHINRSAVYISQCNKMQQKLNTVTVQYINSEQFNTIEFNYLSQAKNTN